MFVVIRLDELDTAPSLDELQHAVTTPRAFFSKEEAELEVQRLNALNEDKACRYFWRVVRIERRIGQPTDLAANKALNSTRNKPAS